jgi:hypothetical protein
MTCYNLKLNWFFTYLRNLYRGHNEIISQPGPHFFYWTFNLKIWLEAYGLAHFFQFFMLISNMAFSKRSIRSIGRADTHGPSPQPNFWQQNSAIPPWNVAVIIQRPGPKNIENLLLEQVVGANTGDPRMFFDFDFWFSSYIQYILPFFLWSIWQIQCNKKNSGRALIFRAS